MQYRILARIFSGQESFKIILHFYHIIITFIYPIHLIMMKRFALVIILLAFICYCSPQKTESNVPIEQTIIAPHEKTLNVSVTTEVSEDVYVYTANLGGAYLIEEQENVSYNGEIGFLCSEESNPHFENSFVYVCRVGDIWLNEQVSFSRMVFLDPNTKYYYRSYIKINDFDGQVFLGNVNQLRTSSTGSEVDLGLKTNWYAYDLGATSVMDSGFLLAYGESKPKQEYLWDNYKWKNELITGTNDVDYDWELALKEIGEGWRIPTQSDFEELVKYCTFYLAERNSIVYGAIAMRNGEEVFFPNIQPGKDGPRNRFWTSGIEIITETDTSDPRNPQTKTRYVANAFSLIALIADHEDFMFNYFNYDVYHGCRVRPVKDWIPGE